MKTLQKLIGMTLPIVAAMVAVGSAGATQFSNSGTDCAQNFTTTPQIEFDNSTGTAVNGSTSTKNFYCGGTSNLDKNLLSVVAEVVDRSASAVECTAYNGSFTAGPVASAGTDPSYKSLTLNITDAAWFEATVKCDVPGLNAGIGSGVHKVYWLTN